MPPTTLKLPAELRQRIHTVAEANGTSAHAFMIEALERETRLAEQRRDFVETALASRAEFARDQSGYAADEVHAYFAARVKDKPVSRPRARRWRR